MSGVWRATNGARSAGRMRKLASSVAEGERDEGASRLAGETEIQASATKERLAWQAKPKSNGRRPGGRAGHGAGRVAGGRLALRPGAAARARSRRCGGRARP